MIKDLIFLLTDQLARAHMPSRARTHTHTHHPSATIPSIWSCREDKAGILLQCTQGQQLFFTPEHHFNIQLHA